MYPFQFAVVAWIILSIVAFVALFLTREKVPDDLEGTSYIWKGDPLTWTLAYGPLFVGVGLLITNPFNFLIGGGVILYGVVFFLLFTINPGPINTGMRVWIGKEVFFQNCRITHISILQMRYIELPHHNDVRVTVNHDDPQGTVSGHMQDSSGENVNVDVTASAVFIIQLLVDQYPRRVLRMFLDDIDKKSFIRNSKEEWSERIKISILKIIVAAADETLQKYDWTTIYKDVEELNKQLKNHLNKKLERFGIVTNEVLLEEFYGQAIDELKTRAKARQDSATRQSVAESEASARIAEAEKNAQASIVEAEKRKEAETARLEAEKKIADKEKETRAAQLLVAGLLAQIELAAMSQELNLIKDKELNYLVREFFDLSPEEREKVIRNVARALRQIPPNTVVGVGTELGGANPLSAIIDSLQKTLKP